MDSPATLVLSSTEKAVAFVVPIALFTIDFVTFSYIWYFRSYPPLKAKHIPLMGLFLLASLLWWFGTMHANGLFGFKGIWKACAIWMVWLQFCFGAMLVFAVFIYRLYTLRSIFFQLRITKSRINSIHVLFYLLPVLSMGIVASVFPEISVRPNGHGTCSFNKYYKGACLAWLGVECTILCYLSWSLRNIRKTFNEFRELCAGCMFAIICLIWNAIILMLHYHTTKWGFYSLLFVDLATCNFFYWLVLAKPLYGHVFHRAEYLDNFLAGLAQDTCTTLRVATTGRPRANTGATQNADALQVMKSSKNLVVSIYQRSISVPLHNMHE
ncbi:hypothetical protein BDF22DRAFT_778987 [Syncephalis plumigaleata]|nr:hypothetical protein BDF22DRAFT_778987 [Syncephalis plumigaleata]